MIKFKPTLGIIGGSGLYKLKGLTNQKWVSTITPFGKPSDKILKAKYKSLDVMFLPRHGSNHNISPNKINYRANIYSLKKLGVTDIISVSAVGSLKKNHKPGDFILVDQYIDRTLNRERTFFDNDLVAHVSMADPISRDLVKIIYDSRNIKQKVKIGGTYIAIDGPQFSTYAESLLFKSWGCDVIGMTNMPEARLVREAEIGYASISMVTDYDCWHKSHSDVTVEQVLEVMSNNNNKVQFLLKSFFDRVIKLKSWNWKNYIYDNLNASIITNLNNVDKKTIRNLGPILKRFINAKKSSI
ncbi:MAG: S-methyl-5'-thioadenosine phosphorylase [Alphaproteobacteria bacterium MarineAlpha9_Bin4]|nr:S-methyl-5'-thioadenosine phosphorylase [Pelagibacterales bacterium]PPR27200.1 MAG: S-methyl-5'-thioadenosine phosphorylase [Alphaproteobacteria bacterium MarineAlpha9_Bin4]|tara:strand:- start:3224 stop:4120 length:897 start_codon:yes stop_codon:yes gene_type:complete